MREREPYLHHVYVGRFQDQSGRRMVRPGERWSEKRMRRYDEAELVAKIRGEQQRMVVLERDWIGNERLQEEEEEEEEEEEDEEEVEVDEERRRDSSNGQPVERHMNEGDPGRVSEESTLSAEELEDRMNQFTYIMQKKFLLGKDHEHLDYTKIDNDETLDDHWHLAEGGQYYILLMTEQLNYGIILGNGDSDSPLSILKSTLYVNKRYRCIFLI